IHKVCGEATNSDCDHDNAHLSQHSQIVEYQPLFDHIRTLEAGKGYYLVGTASVARKFRISGIVYICLNGYNLENVAFEGVNAYSKVYISNCKEHVANVKQKTDATYLFEDINTYIYGSGNKIKFNTKMLSTRGDYGAQEFIAYNAHFSPLDGYVHTDTRTAIIGHEMHRHKTVMSHVTFEDYNTTILISNHDNNRTGTIFEMYDSEIKNNIISYHALYNNSGTMKLENVNITNNTITGNLAFILQTGGQGSISIGTSSIANNSSSASILSVDTGNINLGGRVDITSNVASKSIINVNNSGNVTIEDNANVEISDNEVQISTTNIDSIVYMSGTAPMLNVKGNLNVIDNKAVGTVTKTAKGIGAIGIENATNPRINFGNGILIVKDNISNNDISTRNHMFGMYSLSERFMYQLDGTTFNAENYIEEIALVDNAGNLKKGAIVADNNFTLSNEVAEKSFKASTISDADFRAYKGTPSNVVIGVRKVFFDYNVPAGQTVTAEKIATVNMAGRVTLDIPEVDIDTEECVFLGWAYEKLEVGESDDIAEKVKVANGGTLNMPIDIDTRELFGVWKKNNVFITFEPNEPESPDSRYENKLVSELKTATVSTLTEVNNELLIMDSPYEIVGYTFKGWALSTMSTVDADSYVLEPEYQPGTILTYDQVLAIRPDRKLTLYALWVRDTYTLTLHANDSREGNGSTIGTISELAGSDIRDVNIRFDTYMSDQPIPLPTVGLRSGYNFSGYWTEEKDININDRASYSEVHRDTTWDNTRFYRRASSSELYALWINKEYDFVADNRGQIFDDTTLDGTYDGHYYRSKAVFDDTLTLPKAKSNDSRMAFDYYGANVDKGAFDILEFNEAEYAAYKTNHKVNNNFIYFEEADRYGIATLSAVYMPIPVTAIFDAKEADAAFKDEKGNYVKRITATTSYAWEIGKAFDGGKIATPYRPGYKVSKWVLASDSSVEISGSTKWTYEDKAVVEAVYDLVPYTITYMVGDGEGTDYSHSVEVNYESEIVPQYNNQFTSFGKKVVGFEILNGTIGIDGELTHKVSSPSVTNWIKTNRVMLTDKFTNAYPSDGKTLKLKAIYDDAGTYVRYNKSTPSSVNASYTNEVKGMMADSWIDIASASRISMNQYAVEGYEFIGWSRATISAAEADTIDVGTLYQGNQIVPYEDVKNDRHILDLYAVWKRKTYNFTIHINDSREGSGSTDGAITGLMDASQTVVTVPVKYDEYFGVSVATSGSVRNGYTLKGFAARKDIAIKEKATHSDVWNRDTVVRVTTGSELYALWQNNTYKFRTDLRGQTWEDETMPEGDIIDKEIYFDDVIGDKVLPNAKSAAGDMVFSYWGVNVDRSNDEILAMTKEEFDIYKTNHVVADTFTYFTECERDGYMTFTAVFSPKPIDIKFTANAWDAAIRDEKGNYVSDITITVPSGWAISTALDGGEIPRPYRPGYRFNRWVLASDGITIITKDTEWTYGEDAVVEAVYDLIPYTIVYMPGEGTGANYTHHIEVDYNSEIIPEYNNQFTNFGKKVVGFEILNGSLGIDGATTSEIQVNGEGDFRKSERVMLHDKLTKAYPSGGLELKLEAIWDEAGAVVKYHKSTPSSINSRYTNVVEGNMPDGWIDAERESRIDENKYTVEGYEFIGWSKNPVSVVDADTIDTRSLYQGNQVVAYDTIRNDSHILDLYAVWKRKTYNWTFHINDSRENNGSTTGSITGLMNNSQTTVTVPVKYDEYLGASIATSGTARTGYTLKGFALEKDIAIRNREAYADVYTVDTFVRDAKVMELYTLWVGKKYRFNADLRGQSWEDPAQPAGNITNKEIYFDEALDGNILPNAKANDSSMAFNYWGVNVTTPMNDILAMSESQFNEYKSAHVKAETFTYNAECERDGSITFTAVYMPGPVRIIIDAKESDAAFKDNKGNYVRVLVATTSQNWSLGVAFDDGEIPTPYRPGYKVSKWVLEDDGSEEITKDTVWKYGNNKVVVPVYEVVPYTIVYMPGEGQGTNYTHISRETINTIIIPQYNNTFTYTGKKLVGFEILNGSVGIDNVITHKVSSVSVTNWIKTNRVMLTDKITNAYPNEGNELKLKAIWTDTGMTIKYNKNAPASVDSRYENIVAGEVADSWIDAEVESRITDKKYELAGYEFIGWSKNQVTAVEADTIDTSTLYQANQVVSFRDEKNDSLVLNLYAVWKRKTYNFTFHINDRRENNGSTDGSIPGLMAADQTTVTIPVKYDEYFGTLVDLSGATRNGYQLKGFAKEKNIAVADKESYVDYYGNNTVVRDTDSIELYALWLNKKYAFSADLRGQAWDDASFPAGNITNKEIYFDQALDGSILPKAKSTSDDMAFNYWGVNVDLTTDEILLFDETQYNNYKTAHIKNDTFTYYAECEASGYVMFTAVYMPRPVDVIISAKEGDAAFKDNNGNYVSEIKVTTSRGWRIGEAFDDGNIATPYRPGYKVTGWVLATNSSVRITKDTLWTYGNNVIVEPVYALVPYTIVYTAGEGAGADYSHSESVTYVKDIELEYSDQFTLFGKKVVGFEIINGSVGIDNTDTAMVAAKGTTDWKKSNKVMLTEKFSYAYPSDGNVLKLRAIYSDAGVTVRYHRSTPSSIDSRYTNVVTGAVADSWIDAEVESRITNAKYEVVGYEFIGWSKTPVTAIEADSISISNLYQADQVVAYDTVKNESYILDLYAVWKRKTYNWTFHINDKREGSGSTDGSIQGLISGSQTTATMQVKFDEYFGTSVNISKASRVGYTLRGFTEDKDIAIKDRETYANVYKSDTVVRNASEMELYALWLNKKYLFNADLRGQTWEDSTHAAGNISMRDILFDDEIDVNVLPNAKSNLTKMEFDYWGVNVDKSTEEILNLDEVAYKNYKNSHVVKNIFTYSEECERDGFITFTAVYAPSPVKVIFDAKESDAAFKDSFGNYVKRLVATTSIGWSVGAAFDNGEIPTPVCPGYKVAKWVLASDSSVEITKSTLWNYEDNTVVEPVYDAINYIVEYYPGEAGGSAKQSAGTIAYNAEFIPEYNVFKYSKHKIVGWKVLNPGQDISGNVTMKVAEISSGAWTYTDIINVGQKATNVFADEGDKVKLEAIWEESVYKVEYVRKAPNSLDPSYTNEINESTMSIVEVETGEEVVIADYGYTTSGYTMIGWSTKSDIDYNHYVNGNEISLVQYTKGSKVVLSNTKDELIRLYPVWQRKEFSLTIKYPKYATAIKKNITFRYDTYVNDIDIVKGRDYKGDAYYVLGWSLKDPGDAHYSDIDEALADATLTEHIANVNDKVLFRNQSNTLYSVSRQDCIEFIYRVNSTSGPQLDMKVNSGLVQYVLNGSTKKFNILNAIQQDYVFKGWVRDGEIIPAKKSKENAEYYTGRLTVDPTLLRNSETYVVVGMFERKGSKKKSNSSGTSG
ncbi:MAG: hypothetical protein IKP66_07240, partial [Lachnospiraceae bacterium]|nr:hypothetical protein [Lachnospiraceae bacterium]